MFHFLQNTQYKQTEILPSVFLHFFPPSSSPPPSLHLTLSSVVSCFLSNPCFCLALDDIMPTGDPDTQTHSVSALSYILQWIHTHTFNRVPTLYPFTQIPEPTVTVFIHIHTHYSFYSSYLMGLFPACSTGCRPTSSPLPGSKSEPKHRLFYVLRCLKCHLVLRKQSAASSGCLWCSSGLSAFYFPFFFILKIDAHLQFERSLGGTAFSRISDISVQSNLLWEIRSRRILVWTNRINLSLSALVSLFTPSPAPLKTWDRLLLIQILIQLIDHFAMIAVSFVQELISIVVPSSQEPVLV